MDLGAQEQVAQDFAADVDHLAVLVKYRIQVRVDQPGGRRGQRTRGRAAFNALRCGYSRPVVRLDNSETL